MSMSRLWKYHQAMAQELFSQPPRLTTPHSGLRQQTFESCVENNWEDYVQGFAVTAQRHCHTLHILQHTPALEHPKPRARGPHHPEIRNRRPQGRPSVILPPTCNKCPWTKRQNWQKVEQTSLRRIGTGDEQSDALSVLIKNSMVRFLL